MDLNMAPFRTSRVLSYAAIVFITAELTLRMVGLSPGKIPDSDPTLRESSLLGWEPKPGKYSLSPISLGSNQPIQIAILPDGSRRTSLFQKGGSGRRIYFLVTP